VIIQFYEVTPKYSFVSFLFSLYNSVFFSVSKHFLEKNRYKFRNSLSDYTFLINFIHNLSCIHLFFVKYFAHRQILIFNFFQNFCGCSTTLDLLCRKRSLRCLHLWKHPRGDSTHSSYFHINILNIFLACQLLSTFCKGLGCSVLHVNAVGTFDNMLPSSSVETLGTVLAHRKHHYDHSFRNNPVLHVFRNWRC
jgi:hypothetical protein